MTTYEDLGTITHLWKHELGMRSEVKERNVGKNPNGEIYSSKNDQIFTARANASHFGRSRDHFGHRDRHDQQIKDVEYEKVLPHLILHTVAGPKSIGDPTFREADFTGLGVSESCARSRKD